MDILISIGIYAGAVACMAASIRMAIKGCAVEVAPKSVSLNVLTHPGWCLCLLVTFPLLAGQFARCEVSPIPWQAFSMEYSQHGLLSGFLALVVVITVDLWLFWIPSHFWITGGKNRDRTKRLMARIINILVGLLIVSAANPVYKLIEM